MRTCYKCGIEKELTDFPKNGVTSYGKQVYKYKCKACEAQRLKLRRESVSKPRVKKQAKEQISVWFWKLKQTCSCADCGISFLHQPYLCDFHHIDPTTKKYNVGGMYKHSSREQILEEIAKCVTICANCHRMRHYKNRVSELNMVPDQQLVPV